MSTMQHLARTAVAEHQSTFAAASLIDAGANGSWVGVDLDGTLAEPLVGPYDPSQIGPPKPEMVELVRAMVARGQDVRIFTARVAVVPNSHGHSVLDVNRAELAIKLWCMRHIGVALRVTCIKDHLMVAMFDDIAHPLPRRKECEL